MAEPKNMQKLPILCKYFAGCAKNYGAEGGFVQTPCYFEAAGAIYSKQFYAWRKPAQIPKGGKGGKIATIYICRYTSAIDAGLGRKYFRGNLEKFEFSPELTFLCFCKNCALKISRKQKQKNCENTKTYVEFCENQISNSNQTGRPPS